MVQCQTSLGNRFQRAIYDSGGFLQSKSVTVDHCCMFTTYARAGRRRWRISQTDGMVRTDRLLRTLTSDDEKWLDDWFDTRARTDCHAVAAYTSTVAGADHIAVSVSVSQTGRCTRLPRLIKGFHHNSSTVRIIVVHDALYL